jgi:hypothetical protein
MGNYLSKDKKRIRNPTPTTSIRDWLNDLSREHGQWQTIQKSQMSTLKMDSSLST